MPLPIYLTLHAEAELSLSDRKMLANWAEEQADQFPDGDEEKE